MRNVSLIEKIDQQPDTINLKLLSFEIIDLASPGILCGLRVKFSPTEPPPLILQLSLLSFVLQVCYVCV